MADCMTFPDTVEEFMEQYKVVDTEQVYTNGIEFVPIYRMRQWFEHEPEIVRCKDCAKREYCRTSTVWAVAPDDNWYCADAERRTDDDRNG